MCGAGEDGIAAVRDVRAAGGASPVGRCSTKDCGGDGRGAAPVAEETAAAAGLLRLSTNVFLGVVPVAVATARGEVIVCTWTVAGGVLAASADAGVAVAAAGAAARVGDTGIK